MKIQVGRNSASSHVGSNTQLTFMPSDLSSLCSSARAEDTTSVHTIGSREEAYKVLSSAHMSSFAPLSAARSGKSRKYYVKKGGTQDCSLRNPSGYGEQR